MKITGYEYKTAETKNLEILGSHDTVVLLTNTQATKLASMLLNAIQNSLEDGSIPLTLTMNEPTIKGQKPTFSVMVNNLNWIEPQLHYAIVEGHEILVPDFEDDENV